MRVHRPNDSSKKRVAPFFQALALTASTWPRKLLDLATVPSAAEPPWKAEDLTPVNCYWQSAKPKMKEYPLKPPASLLEWLVWNAEMPKRGMPKASATTTAIRKRLLARDPETISKALDGLATGKLGRQWYVLEGESYPDAFIETPDALIVVEGKYTERGTTTSTTWLPKRHQMLRHLDGAWEIRGRRSVYGLFIVEADTSINATAVPPKWLKAARETITEQTLKDSLPHRQDSEERKLIGRCLVGITTWQAIQVRFGLDPALLK